MNKMNKKNKKTKSPKQTGRTELSLKKKIAKVLTRIFSPLTSIFFISIIIYLQEIPRSTTNAIKWFSLMAIVTVLATATVLLFLKFKLISNWDVTNRKERPRLFAALSLIIVLAVGIAKLNGFDAAAGSLLYVAIMFTAAFLITLFWKVSLHTLSVTTFALFLISYIGSPWSLLLMFIPVTTAWTRILLKNHTKHQAIGGILLAILFFLLWTLTKTPITI